MTTKKEFLKPDWKKIGLFAIFALITLAAHSNVWFFPDSSGPFWFDVIRGLWLFLAIPAMIMFSVFSTIVNLVDLPALFPALFPYQIVDSVWLPIIGGMFYFYLLSCMVVFTFDRYIKRFSKWHWIVIIIIAFVLYLSLDSSLLVDTILGRAETSIINILSSFLAVFLSALLYLYLLFCIGFFISDRFKKNIAMLK